MRRSLFLLLVACTACGDATPTADAAIDGSVPDADASALVEAPAPPALPTMAPCFDGFRQTTDADGLVRCEPWPASGRGDCAPHEAHFPGRPGCERIGSGCPSSGFAEDLPASGVIYVRPGEVGGDGSRTSPFGNIAAALATAADGDILALGVGIYDETPVIDRAVHLLGACAESTVLRSDSSSVAAGVVTIRAADVTVENVQISESSRAAIWIEGAVATATIRDLVIRDVTMIGIDVERGASVDVARVRIDGVALAATTPFTGFFGRGINVESGSSAQLDSLVVSGAHEFGILSFSEGSYLSAARVAIDRMMPRADGTAGIGMMALDGASLDARGVVVEDALEFGVAAEGAGSRISLEDAVVTDTRPNGSGIAGRGLNLQDGAAGSCTRCLITDSPEINVFSRGAAGLELRELVIGERSSRDGASSGRGIEVQGGGEVTVTRAWIADGRETGVLIDGADSTLTITDLTVTRIRQVGAGILGRAVTVQNGARFTLSRGRFEDVSDMGLLGARDCVLELEDLSIRRISPWASGDFGRGLEVQLGCTLRGTRIDIEETFDVGLALLNDGAAVVRDLRVVANRTAACATTSCPSRPGGHGIGVYASELEVDGLMIDDHDLCGIHVASEGTATLRSGVVSNNSIGACIQSPRQELEALQDGVDYLDNDLNLETTTLPVPQPATEL